MIPRLQIIVNPNTYVKDPESSDLGQKILTIGIEMLDEMGFEVFTFKKLADRCGTTEASVYRYFESKHQLLLYLINWYWAGMEYRLAFAIANVPSAEERLMKALGLLTSPAADDPATPHINEAVLHRIVVAESPKAFFNKEVDRANSAGIFSGYKSLVQRVSDIVMEINPSYAYPHMLVSTLIEGSHYQRFFALHLPRLTDTATECDAISDFCMSLATNAIKPA